jgi:hypothetical protein
MNDVFVFCIDAESMKFRCEATEMVKNMEV